MSATRENTRSRARPDALLVVGRGWVRTFVLDKPEVVVGRDAASNLVLSDPRVSALHAELLATPRGVRVRDLGSKNGVWVESVRLTEGYLTEPTTIFIGRASLQSPMMRCVYSANTFSSLKAPLPCT